MNKLWDTRRFLGNTHSETLCDNQRSLSTCQDLELPTGHRSEHVYVGIYREILLKREEQLYLSLGLGF